MANAKIGVQLCTLKNPIREIGLYETLKRCADIGFHCIEVSQIPINNESIVLFKKAKDEFNIEISALSAMADSGGMPGLDCLENDYDKIVSACRELDCNLVRGGATGSISRMETMEDALAFCRNIQPHVEKLAADNIDYYYHNHAFEFRKIENKHLLDILFENTSLGFELDIHWVHVGGVNPVDLIKKYAGRIRLLHLKDYRIVPIQGDFHELRKKGINPQYSSIQFAEIGEGSLDIKGCIEAGLAGGTEYFLIEQENTYGLDPFDSLQIGYNNLVSMGFGSLL